MAIVSTWIFRINQTDSLKKAVRVSLRIVSFQFSFISFNQFLLPSRIYSLLPPQLFRRGSMHLFNPFTMIRWQPSIFLLSTPLYARRTTPVVSTSTFSPPSVMARYILSLILTMNLLSLELDHQLSIVLNLYGTERLLLNGNMEYVSVPGFLLILFPLPKMDSKRDQIQLYKCNLQSLIQYQTSMLSTSILSNRVTTIRALFILSC